MTHSKLLVGLAFFTLAGCTFDLDNYQPAGAGGATPTGVTTGANTVVSSSIGTGGAPGDAYPPCTNGTLTTDTFTGSIGAGWTASGAPLPTISMDQLQMGDGATANISVLKATGMTLAGCAITIDVDAIGPSSDAALDIYAAKSVSPICTPSSEGSRTDCGIYMTTDGSKVSASMFHQMDATPIQLPGTAALVFPGDGKIYAAFKPQGGTWTLLDSAAIKTSTSGATLGIVTNGNAQVDRLDNYNITPITPEDLGL